MQTDPDPRRDETGRSAEQRGIGLEKGFASPLCVSPNPFREGTFHSEHSTSSGPDQISDPQQPKGPSHTVEILPLSPMLPNIEESQIDESAIGTGETLVNDDTISEDGRTGSREALHEIWEPRTFVDDNATSKDGKTRSPETFRRIWKQFQGMPLNVWICVLLTFVPGKEKSLP